jgi:signal transduction histidine kinase
MNVREYWTTRRARVTEKPLNLRRSFLLLSLICIVLMSSASAWLLSQFLTAHMLHRDAEVTKQFVQSIVNTLQPATYFSELPVETARQSHAEFFTLANRGQVKAAFEDFFQHLAYMPEVVRANVFAADQTIIWSKQPSLIGRHFRDNHELQQALSGRVTVKKGAVKYPGKQPEKAEHVRFDQGVRYFVETYIPIWNAAQDTVIGVVEVYKIPDALFHTLAQGYQLIWGSALGGAFLLYGALFWIVRRAEQVIDQQGEQLVASETLATIGEMASAVVHNIRNPLASIRTSAEIIYEEEDALAVQPQSEDIMTEVDRLEGWLRDLLTYAQPLTHTPTSVPLPDLIQDALQHVTSRLDKQKVQLQLDVAATLPPLCADAALLHQAIYSILSNALDAMPTGGTLTLEARQRPGHQQIDLRIRDTGQGLSPEQLSQAFRPFFTTKQRSLGIGLSFAKRIVERHGGVIEMRSQVGQGTTVLLTLPQVRRINAWRKVWSLLKTKRPWQPISPPT